jgi:hypothetical protein
MAKMQVTPSWRDDAQDGTLSIDRRVGDRRSIKMDVRVVGSGLRRHVGHATDLSLSGCRLMCGSLRVGDTVQLRLGAMGGIRAEVVWASGVEAGVRFQLPLHAGVLDHLLSSSSR